MLLLLGCMHVVSRTHSQANCGAIFLLSTVSKVLTCSWCCVEPMGTRAPYSCARPAAGCAPGGRTSTGAADCFSARGTCSQYYLHYPLKLCRKVRMML